MWLKEKDNGDIYAYILWLIQKYRCRVNFDGIKPNPIELLNNIRKDISYFINPSSSNQIDKNSKLKTVCECSHPGCKFSSARNLDNFKYIMFDAAFDKISNIFSYALVLTDHNGVLYDFAGGTGICTAQIKQRPDHAGRQQDGKTTMDQIILFT